MGCSSPVCPLGGTTASISRSGHMTTPTRSSPVVLFLIYHPLTGGSVPFSNLLFHTEQMRWGLTQTQWTWRTGSARCRRGWREAEWKWSRSRWRAGGHGKLRGSGNKTPQSVCFMLQLSVLKWIWLTETCWCVSPRAAFYLMDEKELVEAAVSFLTHASCDDVTDQKVALFLSV